MRLFDDRRIVPEPGSLYQAKCSVSLRAPHPILRMHAGENELCNSHCEEAAGRRGNLLPFGPRGLSIFLGVAERRSNLSLESMRLPRAAFGGSRNDNPANEAVQTNRTTAAAFTFVEVLAALAVVSISLLGLLRLHLISITMADSAEATSKAVFLAREKIAETLALGYPEIGVDTGVVENDTSELRWRTEVSDFAPAYRGVEAGLAGLRRISVDVAWNQGVGRKHLQMSTCVADGKLR